MKHNDFRCEHSREQFLPVSVRDMQKRNWAQLDIILITGDAYVDHPAFGTALIGRVLESRGYRVGIIAQPDWKSVDDFRRLGRPRLFFGITSGNTDSMVANRTPNNSRRKKDDYAPGRVAGLRPDRALIVYANRAKEAFRGVTVVLGGIEASTRRLAHYDFWDDRVRHSVLVDAKADLLVFGMGERQIVEIAERLDVDDTVVCEGIRGTAFLTSNPAIGEADIILPSFDEVSGDKNKFIQAHNEIHFELDPHTGKRLLQKDGTRYVIINPPALPLSMSELDAVYALPYARAVHPDYQERGGVKAFETVQFSITSHRGCCGQCSFCALFIHQGRIVQSRSKQSILSEVKQIVALPDFRGTITDVGGPTANLYKAQCPVWDKERFCADKKCLLPQICRNLTLAYDECVDLYQSIKRLSGVKHVFIASGFRHDLLVAKDSQTYLEEICSHNISGRMKVAPEHCSPEVLRLMNKPDFSVYEAFIKQFQAALKKTGKKLFLVNYFISAHPGSSAREAKELARYLRSRGMNPEQIQDFIALPMTRSACMYYTGKDPESGTSVSVARSYKERRMQRSLIQGQK
jgi:uncharacterized radical SAM protein YgiQ